MPIDPGTVLPSTQSSPEALPRYTLLVRESPRHEPPPYTRTRDAAVPGETRDRSRSALLERVSFDISDGKPRLFCFGEDDMVKRIWKIEWERGMEMGVVQRSSTRVSELNHTTEWVNKLISRLS